LDCQAFSRPETCPILGESIEASRPISDACKPEMWKRVAPFSMGFYASNSKPTKAVGGRKLGKAWSGTFQFLKKHLNYRFDGHKADIDATCKSFSLLNEITPSIIWASGDELPRWQDQCAGCRGIHCKREEESNENHAELGETASITTASTTTTTATTTASTTTAAGGLPNYYNKYRQLLEHPKRHDWCRWVAQKRIDKWNNDKWVWNNLQKRWTVAEEWWQAGAYPCSAMLGQVGMRPTPANAESKTCSGDCQGLEGTIDPDGFVSLVDFADGLTLVESTQRNAILYQALAAINAHAIAAVGNFGPDMGADVSKKVAVLGWGLISPWRGNVAYFNTNMWNVASTFPSLHGHRKNWSPKCSVYLDPERRRVETMSALQFASIVLGQPGNKQAATLPTLKDWLLTAISSSFKPHERRDYMEATQDMNKRSLKAWYPHVGAIQFSAKRCRRGIDANVFMHVGKTPYSRLQKMGRAEMGYLSRGATPKAKDVHFEALRGKTNVLFMKSKKLGCKSKAVWTVRICSSCHCRKGVVNAGLKHELAAGSAAKCASWFAQTDQFIHAYMANVRTTLMVEKKLICIKKEGLAKTNKGANGKHVKSQLKPIPRGYTDVTKQYINKLTGTCKLAVVMGMDASQKRQQNPGLSMFPYAMRKQYKAAFLTPNGAFPGIDPSVLPKISKAYFWNKMVCADKNYSDEVWYDVLGSIVNIMITVNIMINYLLMIKIFDS